MIIGVNNMKTKKKKFKCQCFINISKKKCYEHKKYLNCNHLIGD